MSEVLGNRLELNDNFSSFNTSLWNNGSGSGGNSRIVTEFVYGVNTDYYWAHKDSPSGGAWFLVLNGSNLRDYERIDLNMTLNASISSIDYLKFWLKNTSFAEEDGIQLFAVQNTNFDFVTYNLSANISADQMIFTNDGGDITPADYNLSASTTLYWSVSYHAGGGGAGVDLAFDDFSLLAVGNPTINDYGTNPAVPNLNDLTYLWANVSGEDLLTDCVFDASDPNGLAVLNHENASSNSDLFWNSSSFEANQTGIYWYNITCYEGAYNLSTIVSNGFDTNDTIPPEIILVNPVGGFGFTSRTGIPLSWSVVDATGLRSCWYTLDNGISNTSISCSQNTTFSVGSNGDYTLFFYGEDFGSNQAFNQSSFSVNQPDLIGGGGGGGPTTIINISAKSTLGRVDKYVFILSGRGNFSDVIGINKKVKVCQATNDFLCSYKNFDVSVSREFTGGVFYEVFEGELLVESIDGDAVRIPLAAHLINIGWAYPTEFDAGGFGNDYLFEMEGDLITGIRVWWVGLLSISLAWIWIERRKTRNVYAKRVVSYKKQLFKRLQ